jgi:hypothetical protein
MFNPIILGWMNYYGRYYKSALDPALRYLDRCLAHGVMAKYNRLRRHRRRAAQWVTKVVSRDPTFVCVLVDAASGSGWAVRAG